MKKWMLMLLAVLLVVFCGCTAEEAVSDDCEFLTRGNWEGNDTQCVNVIDFDEDGSFSNWCYCGSPIGDSDLTERFLYRASDRAILLLDPEGETFETGTVLYADDWYLVVDLWGRTYVYENLNEERPTVRPCAQELVGTDEITKPCLHILGYENGMLTVSSYDYDGDAEADYEKWTLPVREDVVFTSVAVNVVGDAETVEFLKLSESDYEHIGEFYTGGYVEIDGYGEVASVVFYGELIVQDFSIQE